MRVLLTTLNAKYIHINLAIRLLYELNRDKEGLDWKEFTIKEDQDEIAKVCAQYDVVAFSCYIWNITPTLSVLQKIKSLNPDTKILLGGPEVSYDFEDVISNENVDYIIAGEGEIPFKTFLDNFPNVEGIPNLIYKINGKPVHLKKAETFDLINYKDIRPYQHDSPETIINRVAYIETSRGCPYKCEFCLASLDNKVRYLPDEHIKANLLYLMQHGKVIKFLDRTFNIKKDFTLDIFNFILEHHRPGNVFQFEITADILHPDIIKFINEKIPLGLLRFEIGIQTVNQKANLEVSRKQNFEKTKSIIRQVEKKVELHLDLIVGMALDEWDDIKYSFEEVFKLYAPELQLGFLKFLKGTPLRYKHEKHGFEFDPMPPYQIIRSNYLSAEQLQKIEKLEHALEIYWNDGRAKNTLRYAASVYSSFDFLMGLGIYFGTQKDYHKFSLSDIFQIIKDFCANNYPDDKILPQLIAFDYYLQSKVRPKQFILEDLPSEQKEKIISKYAVTGKSRDLVLSFTFDLETFIQSNTIVQNSSLAVLRYSGTTQPEVHFESNSLAAVENV